MNQNEEIIKILINELKSRGLIKEKSNAFKNTEVLLYNYNVFKESIRLHNEQLQDLKDYGIPNKSKSITTMSTNVRKIDKNDQIDSAITNLFGWLFFGLFMIMIKVMSFSVIWLNFDNDKFANDIIVKSYDVLSKMENDDVCDYVKDNKVDICISYLLSQRTSFDSAEKEIAMPFAKRDIIWLVLNTGLILLAGMGLRVFEMYYSLLIASNQAVFDLTATWIISETAVLGSVYLSTYLGYKGIITINKSYGILVIAPIVIRMLAFLF